MTLDCATQTMVRMALAMCAADPASSLRKAQRAWLVARLQQMADGAPVPLTPDELRQWTPVVLLWADAHRPALLATLRPYCIPTDTAPPARSDGARQGDLWTGTVHGPDPLEPWLVRAAT